VTRPPVHTAEESFVAALMAFDDHRARPLAVLLHPDDFAAPAIRLVHELVEQLCDAGVSPDPAAVLALAISEERVRGEHLIKTFTGVLMRLMDHRALNDPASVRWYAAQALEQAWRRRTVEMATRLAQVADHADPDELERLTHAEQAAVDAVRARHRALTRPRGLVVAA
jgi:replicative DNA helicase